MKLTGVMKIVMRRDDKYIDGVLWGQRDRDSIQTISNIPNSFQNLF